MSITGVLLLFCFVCVLFPRIIATRSQFFIGFGAVLLSIAVQPFTSLMNMGGPIIIMVLNLVATLLLFLSAGGLSMRGLSKEMMSGFEVIRRGETEKEVIIPFGEKKQRKTAVEEIGQPTQRYDLGDTGSQPAAKKDDGPIPMD